MKAADGVYYLKIPILGSNLMPENSLGYTLTYLVEEKEGFILVDTGWDDEGCLEAFQNQLQEIGLSFSDIRYVVVTHFHPDHAGLAKRIKELSDACLIMHRLDLPRRIRSSLSSQSHELRHWLARQGYPAEELDPLFSFRFPASIPDLEVDRVVEGGEQVGGEGASLYALWTPGHTPGHLCLYDARRKLLFSGDHVLPQITPNISYSPLFGTNPLQEYLSSISRLRDLDVGLVLPAHQFPFGSLPDRLDDLVRHHHQRLEEVLVALKEGPKTAYQLATRITWNLGPWEALSLFSRYLAFLETMAHVHFLLEARRVRAVEREGVVLYTL